METPIELAESLGFHFPEMQADVIASEVYQPLLEEIERLKKIVESLQSK